MRRAPRRQVRVPIWLALHLGQDAYLLLTRGSRLTPRPAAIERVERPGAVTQVTSVPTVCASGKHATPAVRAKDCEAAPESSAVARRAPSLCSLLAVTI